MFTHSVLNSTKSTRYDRVYAPASTRSRSKDILGFWGIVCCKLTPTLVWQIWRHHYFIGRNEYLISTLLESTVP